ncbi:helix-turn-helix transcriptional regulator [Paenisporosarcina sp. TG-14]|uniref:helix-turn-helix transcriptional regulator n=1 Tax=Paenisporosarcina sp. TG-14 TaxID=1231057 RepID=UPI001ED9B8E4|nr:helix-turn-helix transcriptional regulator [Paenisporosarcina sp. TG-14]
MKEGEKMQIGSLIKYHRTKMKMTQSQLAIEICSITHLSKIENNSKEANVETIRLLLNRLEINVQDAEESEHNIHILLEQIIKNIHYIEHEKSRITFLKLDFYKEIIAFTKYIYLYEIYKLRYYIFIKDLKLADDQIRWLNTQKQNFSQHEQYLLLYFSAILLILKGEYGEAEEKLSIIIQEIAVSNTFEGEIYYHLALVKGYLEQSGHAIYYGKKAMEFYKDQFNYKRILHVHMSLAINYSQSKIYEEALVCYEHLIRNAEMLKENDLLPHIYHNIGDLRHKMGDYLIALEYFKKSSGIFNKDTEEYLLCLHNIALTEFRLEKWIESKNSFTILNEKSIKMKVPQYQLYSSFYLLLLNNQKQKAMSFLEDKVVPYIVKMDKQKEYHHYFSKMLAEHFKNEGKYEKAVKFIL